jgi:hypothetical protein
VSDREAVLRLLARERLCVDAFAPGRTTFLSHLGAQPRLVPGPWIAHRELLMALALANLTPEQRESLARAVLIDHEREFGVGRVLLSTLASGLPFGGSSLLLRPRSGAPVCLYTWALGQEARPATCEWLLLRAQPEWATEGAAPLTARQVQALAAVEEDVVIFVPSAVAARQVAELCLPGLEFTAHPRFTPHLEGARSQAKIAIWPHDAVDGASLARRPVSAGIMVDAPEPAAAMVQRWAERRGGVSLAAASCPGRLDRAGLLALWRRCGAPKILLRGDPAWAAAGLSWLREIGATVELQPDATQLGLFVSVS